MTEADPANRNPLREAMVARELAPLEQALAPAVILRSPVFSVEFEGRDEVLGLFEVLFDVFGEMDYWVDTPGDPHMFAWRSDVDGEPVEGVDIVRYGSAGEITEITVYMRPLRGIAAFLDKAGPLMGARRSRSRGLLLKVMGPPPTMMMRSLAGLGPKLLGLGRDRNR